MAGFETLLTLARTYGFFEFYLPFLLVFSLFYGLLEKSKVFGDTGRRINVIVALVAALYILIFSPYSATISTFFANFFGATSMIIITLVVGMMIVGVMVGPMWSKEGWDKVWKHAAGGVVLIGFILALAIFWGTGGFDLFGQTIPGFGAMTTEDVILIFLIIVTAVALWFMTRGGED